MAHSCVLLGPAYGRRPARRLVDAVKHDKRRGRAETSEGESGVSRRRPGVRGKGKELRKEDHRRAFGRRGVEGEAYVVRPKSKRPCPPHANLLEPRRRSGANIWYRAITWKTGLVLEGGMPDPGNEERGENGRVARVEQENGHSSIYPSTSQSLYNPRYCLV